MFIVSGKTLSGRVCHTGYYVWVDCDLAATNKEMG
jgi:hypothetical protein